MAVAMDCMMLNLSPGTLHVPGIKNNSIDGGIEVVKEQNEQVLLLAIHLSMIVFQPG